MISARVPEQSVFQGMRNDTPAPSVNLYVPGENGDAPLLHWYAQLVATDDIAKILGPSVFPLHKFMQHFTQADVRLFYLADDHGWWLVSWSFPMAGGGSWGLWCREDMRLSASRKGIRFIMETLADTFLKFAVVVNICKDPENVEKTKRLGYTYLGKIPLLFEGDDCHILYMTRDTFMDYFNRWEKRTNGRR